MKLYYWAIGSLLVLGACGSDGEEDDNNVEPTVQDTNLDDDAGDDDVGDDDNNGDDDESATPEPETTLPSCNFVTGDEGGVTIAKDRGEYLIVNTSLLKDQAYTWDIDILSDETTVYEVYEVLEGNDAGSYLFRSFDSGCEFEEIESLGGKSFRGLEVDPSDEDRMYLWSPNSATILSTTNAWRTSATITPGAPGIVAMAVDPAEGARLSAVGSDAKLYTSTDGGATWKSTDIGIPEGATVENAAFSPSDPNVIIVGTDTVAWYRSVDGGQSWEAANTGLYSEGEEPGSPELVSLNISFSTADPNLVYGVLNRTTGGGEIYRSTDLAQTWTRVDDIAVPKESSDTTPLAVSLSTRVYADPVSPDIFYTWYGSYYTDLNVIFYVCEVNNNQIEYTPYEYAFQSIYSMAFHPLDPTTFYLGRLNYGDKQPH